MRMRCMSCGKDWAEGERGNPFICECGGVLDVKQEFRDLDTEALKRVFHQRLSARTGMYASGVWRYKELILPDLPEERVVTRYEGNTALFDASPDMTRSAGIGKLWFKAQSGNPSGSFKDNGMTAAVSYGRHLGYTRFTCSSTGNTASSLAMYAAAAGGEAHVFLPGKHISYSKVLQTLAYGGRIHTIDGTYDDGVRFSEQHAEELGLFVCNSINPYRIEGQKSIVFELAQTLDWRLPDWILIPGGALSHGAAVGKGVDELYRLGFIRSKPRIAIVQAEGASPFYKMTVEGKEALVPEPKPFTRASALNIGNPPSWQKALRYAIRGTDGLVLCVSDEEIMEAKREIDRAGIGCEPASAAGLAGLKQLSARGLAGRSDSAVCILTGHLLKDADVLEELYAPGLARSPVPLTPDAVRKVLGR